MNAPTRPTIITLQPRLPMLLKRVAGARVTAISGCVWITQYGHAGDIVLSPGQSAELALPTITVMSSTHGARLSFEPLITRRARPSLWRRLAGLFDPRWSSAAARSLCRHLPTSTPGQPQ